MQQVINAHLHTPPPRASAINPRVPAALDAAIQRGMAKEPDDRYGSAGALARAAQRALTTPATPDPDLTMAGAYANHSTVQHTKPVAPPPPPPLPMPPQHGIPKAVLIGIAACVILFVAAAGIAIGIFAGQSGDRGTDNSAQSSSLTRLPSPERTSLPTGQRPTLEPPTAPPSPTRPAAPPPAVTGIDGLGQRCDGGFEVTGNPGAGSRAVRGSTETSCRFVDNVLTAYWDAGGPLASPRTIDAAGGVACNPRTARCNGNRYILDCSPSGTSDWVTCRGGVNAVVHIY